LPLALDGGEHRLTGLARKFAQRLHGRFGIDTRLVDERLTSVEAQRAARESGLTARGSKRHVDPLAAKLILEAFFNDNA
jgi:putative Holliday junction resolvase